MLDDFTHNIQYIRNGANIYMLPYVYFHADRNEQRGADGMMFLMILRDKDNLIWEMGNEILS